MLEYFVYLLYRAVFAILTALPLSFLAFVGNVGGIFAWALSPKYRELAFRNVTIAFGEEKSVSERRRLVRRHFQRLAVNILGGLKLAAMPLEKTQTLIKIENVDAAHRELRAGRPVVFILSHLGNWELQAQMFPSAIGYVRNSTVFQPLRNRYIDRHFRKLRGRAGVELFNRDEGFHQAIDLLRGGGAVGVLSDQHAGDHGMWVPFFGKLASTTSLPALLAKRTGAALIGTAVYPDSPGRWRIVFTEKINQPGDSVEVLTAKMNDLIANQIRRAPEDWFWVHDRWKTPRPNFLLARYKRGVFVPKGNAPLQSFRILVRSSNWLGDSIMSVPAVRAIKAGRPDAHVTIAAPEKMASIWKLVPEVDEIIRLPNKSLSGTVQKLREQKRFDVAISFPNSLRAALELWLAGIERRVGYRGHSRAALLNQIIREPKKPKPLPHHAERFLRIASDCGAETDEPRLRNFDPRFNTESLSAGLCPGAEYGAAKRWLPERFAEAAQAISDRHKLKWILFGTKNDCEVGQKIAETLGGNCHNRIGETNLDQLIDELRRCRLLLTNDTGTMHLGALLGIPVVAIFGSTEPALTAPLGDHHIVLRHHVACSPCFLRDCPIDFRCMKAITVEEAVQAAGKLLDRSGRA